MAKRAILCPQQAVNNNVCMYSYIYKISVETRALQMFSTTDSSRFMVQPRRRCVDNCGWSR